jgi:hypothetical protein
MVIPKNPPSKSMLSREGMTVVGNRSVAQDFDRSSWHFECQHFFKRESRYKLRPNL